MKQFIELIVIIMLIQCNKLTIDNMVGKYNIRSNVNDEFIELYSDGSYFHFSKNNVQKAEHHYGKWSVFYSEKQSTNRISFENFVHYSSPFKEDIDTTSGILTGYCNIGSIRFFPDSPEYDFVRE